MFVLQHVSGVYLFIVYVLLCACSYLQEMALYLHRS